LLKDIARDANTARLAFIFDTRRNVNTITEDVVAVDNDVSDVDTDAKYNSWLSTARAALRYLPLNGNRARHRVYSAGKLNQNAIAGGLDDAAFVLRYGRIDDLAPMGLEGLKGPDLIRTHQTAEARDVTCQNGCQPSLYPLAGHGSLALMPICPRAVYG